MAARSGVLTVLLAGCGGEVACKGAGLAVIEVTVTSQETGDPVLGAVLELDQDPAVCAEEGDGLYTCTTDVPGEHNLLVLGGIEYAGYAQMVQVPELGCDEVVVEVDVTLLAAMAR